MKLLCFQAKRFRWKTHSKTLPIIPDRDIDDEVTEAVVVFVHAEASDAAEERYGSVSRQVLKYTKWLSNKRGLNNIVFHAFAHLGSETAPPAVGEAFIQTIAPRF